MNSRDQHHIAEVQKSFLGFFINNWRVTLLFLIILFFGGLMALSAMPLESDPEVKIPMAVVTTVYPGASPADVEKLVTDRLEEKLKNLDDLKLLTSSSSEGVSSITVEFEASADLTESIRNLRDEVDNAKPDLPEDATAPVVTEINASDQPIITVSLLSNLPMDEMKRYGEDLQDLLEGIPGVSEVILSGLENEEVQILVDIQKLEGYGLSLTEIAGAIQSNHIDFPIGSILTQGYYYQVSLKGQFEGVEELLNLPISNLGSQSIYLRDIATVREVFGIKKTDSYVYRVAEDNYRQAITLQAKKKTGANIIDMTTRIKADLEKYQAEVLPPSVETLITNDWSEYIRDDIKTLGQSGLQTVVLIFLILFVALGRKEAVITGLSIPLIFLTSFIFLNYLGETFNFLVLFSLILSLGLVVDTSIVIMEGVHEGVKEKGLSGRDAALRAISIYKWPLLSGTLTTVAVFLPMTMMTGIMGEYIKHIPLTVTITLLASWFVAVFLLSAIAARVFRDYHKNLKKDKKPFLSRWMDPLRESYLKVSRSILHSKKKRRGLMAAVLIAFVLALATLFFGVIKVQMFPSMDMDFMMVNLQLPTGATLEDTTKVTARAEGFIKELPEVENFVTIIGGAGANYSLGTGGLAGTNKAQITVNLTDMNERGIKSYTLAKMLREKIKVITEAEVEVEELGAGPPSGAPVEIRIKGTEVTKLERAADYLLRELEKIPGTRDVQSDAEIGTGEFHFTLRRDRLSYYGVSAVQVAGELRSAVFGNDSVKILRDGEETPILLALDFRSEACLADSRTQLLEKRDRVTLCQNTPQNISQIENLLINTPKGQIPVSELAEISLHPAITVIRHRDTDTVVYVRAKVEEGYLPSIIVGELQNKLAASPSEILKGLDLDYGGETEDIDESFQSLFNAMIIGIFLIAIILVLQFNSFRQPFIILFTLPLAFIGVIIGWLIFGRHFSFLGFIGIVALAGIVVNDAIVLIDRINYHIKTGCPKLEAIIQSGGERLQPVILTTLTTALGVLPLIFVNEMWVDLALTIACGISFATFLTLFVVPILYNALESDQEIQEAEHVNMRHET